MGWKVVANRCYICHVVFFMRTSLNAITFIYKVAVLKVVYHVLHILHINNSQVFDSIHQEFMQSSTHLSCK